MPRFFIARAPENNIITVTGSDARHIALSLRMKTGEMIEFCGRGVDYTCQITSVTENAVACAVIEEKPTASEPDVFLTLYQAYPKQGKLELIIQKTVELGVSRIVPFISARCTARPDKQTYAKKQPRFQKIAEEAAKQSGRGVIPKIAPLMSFEEALSDMQSAELKLFCYENGDETLSDTVKGGVKTIALTTGSEGGFERGEADKAARIGAVPIYLGERILRCETCPIAVTAVIMNLTGNM